MNLYIDTEINAEDDPSPVMMDVDVADPSPEMMDVDVDPAQKLIGIVLHGCQDEQYFEVPSNVNIITFNCNEQLGYIPRYLYTCFLKRLNDIDTIVRESLNFPNITTNFAMYTSGTKLNDIEITFKEDMMFRLGLYTMASSVPLYEPLTDVFVDKTSEAASFATIPRDTLMYKDEERKTKMYQILDWTNFSLDKVNVQQRYDWIDRFPWKKKNDMYYGRLSSLITEISQAFPDTVLNIIVWACRGYTEPSPTANPPPFINSSVYQHYIGIPLITYLFKSTYTNVRLDTLNVQRRTILSRFNQRLDVHVGDRVASIYLHDQDIETIGIYIHSFQTEPDVLDYQYLILFYMYAMMKKHQLERMRVTIRVLYKRTRQQHQYNQTRYLRMFSKMFIRLKATTIHEKRVHEQSSSYRHRTKTYQLSISMCELVKDIERYEEYYKALQLKTHYEEAREQHVEEQVQQIGTDLQTFLFSPPRHATIAALPETDWMRQNRDVIELDQTIQDIFATYV